MEQRYAGEKERSLLHLEQAIGKTANTVNVRRMKSGNTKRVFRHVCIQADYIHTCFGN